MSIELVPLCDVEVEIAVPTIVGEGPAGIRFIVDVITATVTGDRIRGTSVGPGADWALINGTVCSIDVRETIRTDDGALVYVTYTGRTDVTDGPGSAPIFVSPRFETSDERYSWLNPIQAIGKGVLDGTSLSYEWYEVR